MEKTQNHLEGRLDSRKHLSGGASSIIWKLKKLWKFPNFWGWDPKNGALAFLQDLYFKTNLMEKTQTHLEGRLDPREHHRSGASSCIGKFKKLWKFPNFWG